MIRLIALSFCAILSLSAQVGGPGAPATGGVFSAIASQAEAQAGTNNTKGMTPLRTAEAIAALAAGGVQSIPVNAQAGASYTILTGDRGKVITLTNAGTKALSIAAAGSTGFEADWYTYIKNEGPGLATLTPTTSTVGGGATLDIPQGTTCAVASYNSHYSVPLCTSGNFSIGTGMTCTRSANGITCGPDTSVIQTRNAAITAGSANTYTLDLTPNLGSYSNLTRITVQFHAASTASSTINVDGLGAKKLYLANGTTQITNEMAEDRIAEFVYNDTLDSAAGGFQMVGDGAGAGGSSTSYINLPAATCQYGAAGTGFTLGTTLYPTPTCVTGSNRTYAVLDFPDADGEYAVQWSTVLRGTVTSIDLNGKWRTSATSGDVVWQVQTSCVADAETSDPSWNTAQTITETAKGTTLQENDLSLTGLTLTGCATGERLNLRFFRQRTHASDTLAAALQLIDLGLVINR